jgi:5-hydroxyisourate hydrolase
MAGRLTTHVLDTMSGLPARGMALELRRGGPGGEVLRQARTDADGRLPGPLLEGRALAAGRYEIAFHVGDYFRACGVDLPDPAFLEIVTIGFGVADPEAHYHVPLLVSPYGYTIYRGS